jgi:hypothetical protein
MLIAHGIGIFQKLGMQISTSIIGQMSQAISVIKRNIFLIV